MPASCERSVRLPEGVDLHARPAGQLVRTAMRFAARTEVRASGRTADARSLLAVLALGATGGCELQLRAEGEDAAVALEALSDCVASFA